MKQLISGLVALAVMFAITSMPAQAGNDMEAYKPGAIKAAVDRGETVLIHYKSTW